MYSIALVLILTGFTTESSVQDLETDQDISFVEYNDLSYLPEQDQDNSFQRLNLVVPKDESGVPLLIWVGGGAWAYVDRHREMDLARQFAARGIAVASVGHRLSPAVWRDPALKTGVQHPAHIEDLAAAFRWLYDQAEEYGYDRSKIFVGGFSSGAHLAALLSMDKRRLAEVGLSKDQIRGVIPIAGTFDIPDYHRYFLEESEVPHLAEQHVEAVFGATDEAFLDASPTTYLDSMTVPMLLISDSDLYRYTEFFEKRIRSSVFDDVIVVHFHQLGHGPLWRNLSQSDQSECRDLMISFIESTSADNDA